MTMPIRSILISMALSLPAAQAEAISVGSAGSCTDVYLVSPRPFIASPHFFQIVQASVDDQGFKTLGKVSMFDWATFRACGSKLELKFRFVSEPTRKDGPTIRDEKKTHTIALNGQPIYLGLNRIHGRIISPKKAEETMRDIDAAYSHSAEGDQPTGANWIDDHARYYGKFAQCAHEQSDRCP
jgi:hypothetical protein